MNATSREAVWNYSEVGQMLGLHRTTVAEVAESLGLIPTPIGPSKGLTRRQIDEIRKALKIQRER